MTMDDRLRTSEPNARDGVLRTAFRARISNTPLIRIAVLASLVAGVGAPGLSAQEPVDTAIIARIVEKGRAGSQVMPLFAHLTTTIGPRLAGTPAYRHAADWAAERFTYWGLQDVHLEPFEFGRGWSLEGLTLEMTAPWYFPLVGYPEAWSPPTTGDVVGAPVYIGDWTEEQVRARAAELRGKIVLATRPQPAFIVADRLQPTEHDGSVRIGAPSTIRPEGPVDRQALPSLMQEVGAAVLLQPSQGQHGTMFVLGRRTTPDDVVPSVILASEHYGMLVRMLDAGDSVTLRVAVDVTYHEDDPDSYNVIADLPGTDPDIGDEIVIFGAHLDSWHSSPGATDNADGVATVMEAMRILKALGVQLRRTVRVALWGAEEQGLIGARAHVAQHYAGDENAAAREKVAVYFNHDPGTGPIYGWYLQENAEAGHIFDAWLAALGDQGVRRNVIDRIRSTDHVPFNSVGIPGFNTVQDYFDYDARTHHTNTDFYERVKEEDLQQAAIVMATFVYHAAMRDEKIPR